MGRDPADSLMALLPPVGWADVATKHDLSEVERRIDLRFESLEERFELRFESLEQRLDLRFESFENRLTAQFERAMRTYFIALLSAFAVLLTVATAVSRQLG